MTDLPEDWQRWAATDVQSLAAIWQKRRDTALKNSEALKQFNERFAREWAIETGIIEGLYTIDRGTTQVLIEQGIIASLIPHGATDKPAGRIVDILNDHQATLEGIFDFIGRQRELSTGYIKEVHAALTQHQVTTEALDKFNRRVEVELIRGEWKTQPNSPTRPYGDIHPYSPPEHVAAEMDWLVALHHEHDAQGVPPEIEAAWLHHRFTQIHPFQDGNGRVARVLASLVFLRAGWFPLVINRDDRATYIAALEKADVGDLSGLVMLFAGLQKSSMLRALSLSDDGKSNYRTQVLDAIKNKLNSVDEGMLKERENAFDIAAILRQYANSELSQLQNQINSIEGVRLDHTVTLDNGRILKGFWFSEAVRDIAINEGYTANTGVYGEWVSLTINRQGNSGYQNRSYITVAFHGVGDGYSGLLIGSAFFAYDNFLSAKNISAIAREPFQFSYNESINDVIGRFKPWLDEVILLGLDEWRKRL